MATLTPLISQVADPSTSGPVIIPFDTDPTSAESKNDPLAAYVQGKYQAWKSGRNQLEQRWLEFYRIYRCQPDGQDATRKSERSKLKMPATKEAINNFVFSVSAILFGADPWFDLSPMSPASRRPSVLKHYIRWMLAKERFEEKVRTMLTEMGTYGTAIARIRPVKDVLKQVARRQVQPTDPMTGQVLDTLEYVARYETDYIHPRFDPVSIFNFFTNPTADDIQTAEGIIVESYLHRGQLEAMLKEGTIDRLPTMVATGTGAGPAIDQSDSFYRRLASTGLTPSYDSDRYKVLEWHGYIPESVTKDLEGQTPGEKIVYCCNGERLNDDTEPPMMHAERPFVVGRFEKVPGEFYGMGIAESAHGPQKALDATIRARIDNLAISLNQMFAVNRRKLADGQNYDAYPGKVWLTEGDPREAIVPFVVPDVTGSTYQAAAEYERAIQAAHGVKPVVGGRSDKTGQQTATEISSLMGQAMGQIKEIAKSFENTVLEPTLRWYARILYQFPNKEEQFMVMGEQGLEVLTIESPDISPDTEFIPMGLIQMEQRNNAAKLLQFLGATANPLDAPFVNRPKLIQRVYEAMGFGDSEEIILAPPQHPLLQQMMQMQQMGGGANGAPTPAAPESSQPGEMIPTPSAPGGTPNAE